MKKVFILFAFSFQFLFASGQSSVYKIVTDILSNNGGGTTSPLVINDDVATELKPFFNNAAPNLIIDSLKSNPVFLHNLDFAYSAVRNRSAFAAPSFRYTANIGNVDVTNFANAVASLMIDRAKQELTLAFFNHLQDLAKKYPEFPTLFPKTYDQLRNLLSYTYPQMLPALRTAFLADLQQLPANLQALLELPQFAGLLSNFPEAQMAVKALQIMHDFQQGVTPARVISALNDEALILRASSFYANSSTAFKNVVASLRFAQLFSVSLMDGTGGNNIWITATQANDLLHNEIATRLYLGLLWQQAKDASLIFYVGKPLAPVLLSDMIANNKDNILLLQTKLSAFIDQATTINTAYNTYKMHATNDNLFNFINASLDGIDNVLSTVKVFDTRLQPDNYLAIARKANSLYKDIYAKQYTQAISDGLDILSSIEQMTHYQKKAANALFANASTRAAYKMSSDTLATFIEKVKPYALFIATIADAKSEADIQSALDNAILPVGSSSIKKNTQNNLSVQTYLGAYYTAVNYYPSAIRSWSDRFGVYGPIGLAYTPGFASRGKCGSVSLFASVFDLGAIIDYKLKQDPSTTSGTGSTNTTATKQYSVNLGQIFSPGIHVVYGFGANLPLSLGFGAQYGPGLSKIDATGTTSVINPCWRLNAFLAVDLPFFTLINKTKR
ncbi:MAG TPA: hypothetical protein VG367_21135 [Mucilaginibacter sp.]|jgi:hypothetical protein|nr:hypothetical protein [Mucilaginibacter sp.]